AKEPHVEPESEKFALSPHADLDELREFVRCESLERMQLCMRLQKQQELLEHLSEKALKPTVNGKAAEILAATEGAWQKQMGTEVDELKLSVENLAQDLREIQERPWFPKAVRVSGVLAAWCCTKAPRHRTSLWMTIW
ncbi:unnamed protein product, partial [Effrenium voratum]